MERCHIFINSTVPDLNTTSFSALPQPVMPEVDLNPPLDTVQRSLPASSVHINLSLGRNILIRAEMLISSVVVLVV